MSLEDAKKLALSLMAEHGLDTWTFRFDNAKRRAGVCKYTKKVIGLSRHYTLANDDHHIKDVILHEIAHALVGPGHGHGRVWRNMARKVGARPERCTARGTTMGVKHRYYLWCEGCRKVVARYHKRPRRDYGSGRYYCRACGESHFTLETA